VLPAVVGVLKPDGALLLLIKPQFEAGKEFVERGGVVRDPAVHQRVIAEVTQGACFSSL
jgi:23S rRNA (cytidine1920-2'-O)/16S rRNA (cytidine1409-2'-O)-methyltransferase